MIYDYLGIFLYYISIFGAVLLGLKAAWSDIKYLRIPNYISCLVLICFVFCVIGDSMNSGFTVFDTLYSNIISALTIFLFSYLMFCLGLMGGGDSKLVSVYALWFELNDLLLFVFFVSLSGAILSLFAIIIRFLLKNKRSEDSEKVETGWIAGLGSGQSVLPYGVAIFLGYFFSILNLGLLNYNFR